MLISPTSMFSKHMSRLRFIAGASIAGILVLIALIFAISRYGTPDIAALFEDAAANAPALDGPAAEPDNSVDTSKRPSLQDDSQAADDKDDSIAYALFRGTAEVIPVSYNATDRFQIVNPGHPTVSQLKQGLVALKLVPDSTGWELADVIDNGEFARTYILQQVYSPLPIHGMTVSITADADGDAMSISGQYAKMEGSLYVGEVARELEYEGIGPIGDIEHAQRVLYIGEGGEIVNAVHVNGILYHGESGRIVSITRD